MTKMEVVMCPPKYISSNIKNNIWMEDYPNDESIINVDIAMKQFWDMYSVVSQVAFVWLLPPTKGLQDQVYVANAAAVLPHTNKRTAILANFRAEGRPGEEDAINDLLHKLDYTTYNCPYRFEGEAELKWVRDNIYIGGYGLRTEKSALDWMEKSFDMEIIKVKETDPYLYHLDCSIFPLDTENIMVSVDTIDKKTLDEISTIANIIPVKKDFAYMSMCNSLRIGSTLFCSGPVLPEGVDPEYHPMNMELVDICRKRGIQPVFCNLNEFAKSGAALSCCFMHLSYDNVRFDYP